MKRKPDILVVLAGLLGLGMILSSFGGVNAADSRTEYSIQEEISIQEKNNDKQ